MELKEYFLNNRWGRTPSDIDLKKFTLYPFEGDYIKLIHNNRFTLALKSRQMHLSNLTANYVTWYLMNNSNKTIFWVGFNRDNLKYTHKIFDALFEKHNVEVERVWIDKIKLTNGSVIKFIVPNICEMRGYSADIIVFDEFACMDEGPLNTMVSNMFHQLASDGKIIIETTPQRGNKLLKKLWDEENAFAKHSFHYKHNPILVAKNGRRDLYNSGLGNFLIEMEMEGYEIKRHESLN